MSNLRPSFLDVKCATATTIAPIVCLTHYEAQFRCLRPNRWRRTNSTGSKIVRASSDILMRCSAKGIAAQPIESSAWPKRRTWAESQFWKPESSASTRHRSPRTIASWIRSLAHEHPIPPTPVIRMFEASMGTHWTEPQWTADVCHQIYSSNADERPTYHVRLR